jgi:hypothetical protein
VGQRFAVLTAQGGVVLAASAAIGGYASLAVAILGAFVAIGAIGLWPGELSRVRRSEADERQRLMQYEAIAWSGYLIRPVILVGAVVELYRGTPGPFVLMGLVGSLAEVGALVVLPRLR